MIKQHAAPQSLSDAIRFFADKERAFAFMVQLRWPLGVVCPKCNTKEHPILLRSRMIFKCRSCRQQFSIKTGTIFEDSALGFDKWLPALWLLANSKNGISSYELGRALKVTQKTAWFMLGRIRLAMQARSFAKTNGIVEIDETFIGGLAANMHNAKRKRVMQGRKAGATGKAAAVAAVVRGQDGKPSQVKAHVLKSIHARPYDRMAGETVEPGSKVYTDGGDLYKSALSEYIHETVNHSEKEYVRGEVHTNSVENFWSLLKRSIKGTYVSVDPFHLFRYVDEQVFRFNNRKDNDGERFVSVLREIVGKRLTYGQLIGANLKPATT